MKIGIPKALMYYFYYPFWKTLFESLGFEVVTSDDTSKSILDIGVKEAVAEICVPMKVYTGHVLNLLDKNVDYIYIPRFVSLRKGIFMCPKFMGLPDMIKGLFDGIENKILTHNIVSKSTDISEFHNYTVFIDKLGVSRKDLKNALKKARDKWLEFRALNKQGYDINELLTSDKPKKYDGDITIGLIGYVYNVYDRFVNMDLLNVFRKLNIKVVTFDMMEERIIQRQLKKFKKNMFWEFTNMLLGTAYEFMERDDIDGIIHITAFGCGPDSILEPFLTIDSEKHKKPFMTLRIDEQTGESHVITRVEAFTDLIRIKKYKAEKTVEGVI
ncbi:MULTISPECIES: acyl-CoA dehydratase activase-related protein [Thermoanaerobacter]|uniref:Nucleotide-binding protein (Sugar kinase/HSP70/actin superfamily) n=1 Tax=Thermoanaerobacter pentosaceus TaxID=694059 RepID=A0ABT9M0W6_9THEO|nr:MULTISPECIES: acyl-CoA dehydratase activase-related protein [Thermoanaerobacter]MDP9749736.1 putative nucleotide-binding protein (sugar kinase/HSP70/actin superfamily) [Thermoanaerobacter pentosaceus]